MAGADDPLATLGLPPEALALLIRQQNAQLVEESEKARASAKWSQPNLLPLSIGRDDSGNVVGLNPAMPEFLQSLLSSLSLPSDVASGKVDPMGGEGIARAAMFPLDILGPGMAGEVPGALKNGIDPNVLNIFAGKNSKTADLDELERAQRMVQALGQDGKVSIPTIETIFGRTGWFPGPDGKWRYEIPDYVQPGPLAPDVDAASAKALTALLGKDPATIDLDDPFKKLQLLGAQMELPQYMRQNFGKESGPASAMLEHPELYAAYPQLEQAPMTVGYGRQQSGAFFDDLTKPTEAFGPTNTDIASVMLHELQHGVQSIEGFAGGGNPDWLRNVLANIAPTADQQLLYPEPYMLYRALMGETESRAVQSRYELGTALLDPETAKMADDMGWLAGPEKTTPYFRDPKFGPEETGSYDIPPNFQINPKMLERASNDAAGGIFQEDLKRKLQALKIALAGS